MAVLREAVELGITHIDTSDYYGPYVTNEIIREALRPYPGSLHIVTKVGALRDAEGGWPPALAPEQLRQAVRDNLDHLGLDALDVVNLRVGGLDRPAPGSIAEPFSALAQLQQDGLIRHLGLSTVDAGQIAEAQSIAPVVCVQNFYNLAHRVNDDLIGSLAAQGIAYVPYFPLGGFTPLQSDELGSVAARLGPPRWPWPWPGCCSARRTSCSSPAPRRSRICARTSPGRDWPCPGTIWPNWTVLAHDLAAARGSQAQLDHGHPGPGRGRPGGQGLAAWSRPITSPTSSPGRSVPSATWASMGA